MNIIRALPALAFSFLGASAYAALTPIGPQDFVPGTTTLDFSSLPFGTDVNGLLVDGVLFQVAKNGVSADGAVVIDDGPGITGNVEPPNLVAVFDSLGVALVISLPNSVTQFGYGYAINSQVSVSNATVIQLFAGSTSLGSISFTGNPDPFYTGGFAGVASDTPFNRAVLTFSNEGQVFAADNITFAARTVPEQEPTMILLSITVLVLLLFYPTRRAQLNFLRH